MWFGRRVRRLSRASQDRVADSSAIAAEVLNAIPVVQSYTAEAREAARFDAATENAFRTGVRRTRARAVLVAFIIIANAGLLLWGLYQGTQAVLAGTMTRRPPGRDRRVRDHPGRRGGGAGRGLRRPAARGRRHRAPDGTAGQPLARDVAGPSGAGRARAGRQRHRVRSRHLPLSVAARHGRAEGLQPGGRAGRDRGAGRAPAAPARARCSSCCCASTTRSRAASCSTAWPRASWRCTTCARASASCRRTR